MIPAHHLPCELPSWWRLSPTVLACMVAARLCFLPFLRSANKRVDPLNRLPERPGISTGCEPRRLELQTSQVIHSKLQNTIDGGVLHWLPVLSLEESQVFEKGGEGDRTRKIARHTHSPAQPFFSLFPPCSSLCLTILVRRHPCDAQVKRSLRSSLQIPDRATHGIPATVLVRIRTPALASGE